MFTFKKQEKCFYDKNGGKILPNCVRLNLECSNGKVKNQYSQKCFATSLLDSIHLSFEGLSWLING